MKIHGQLWNGFYRQMPFLMPNSLQYIQGDFYTGVGGGTHGCNIVFSIINQAMGYVEQNASFLISPIHSAAKDE